MTRLEIETAKADGTFPKCPYCGDWVKIHENGNLGKTCCKPKCKGSLARKNASAYWGTDKARKAQSKRIKRLYKTNPDYRQRHYEAILRLTATDEWKDKQDRGYYEWHKKRQEMGLEVAGGKYRVKSRRMA